MLTPKNSPQVKLVRYTMRAIFDEKVWHSVLEESEDDFEDERHQLWGNATRNCNRVARQNMRIYPQENYTTPRKDFKVVKPQVPMKQH